MKKSLLALAVLGAFAGAASAQSSVTLSGGIDLGFVRDGPTKDNKIATAGSGRSNLTFSGTEDLGGGMRAFFLIQHRFKPNDGTVNTQNPPGVPTASPAGSQFWRQTWVGLGGAFGDVRLGRMLVPHQDLNGNYDAFGTDTVGSTHTGGSTRLIRANNTVYYRSPNFSGVQVHASVSEANGQYPAGNGGIERPAGLGVQYAAGPLSVAAAWDRDDQDLNVVGLYGKFGFGVATVMGQYEKVEKSLTNDHKIFSISGLVPFGAMTLKAGVRRAKSDLGAATQTKLGLGLDYALSKRTTLYTDMGKLAGDVLDTGVNLSSQQKRASFDVGIQHKF